MAKKVSRRRYRRTRRRKTPHKRRRLRRTTRRKTKYRRGAGKKKGTTVGDTLPHLAPAPLPGRFSRLGTRLGRVVTRSQPHPPNPEEEIKRRVYNVLLEPNGHIVGLHKATNAEKSRAVAMMECKRAYSDSIERGGVAGGISNMEKIKALDDYARAGHEVRKLSPHYPKFLKWARTPHNVSDAPQLSEAESQDFHSDLRNLQRYDRPLEAENNRLGKKEDVARREANQS